MLDESFFNLKGLGYGNKDIFIGKWMNNLQNNGVPDQIPHYVAYDLGLHFLSIPL